MSAPELWMPLHITRYLMDTKDLDLAQHGAYLLLLMQYWQKGPLPDDDGKLCRIVGIDLRTWRKAIAPALRPFFTTKDGKLHQKRADFELAKAADISGKRRAAALASHKHPPNGNGGGDDPSPDDDAKEGAIAQANAPANGAAKAPASAPKKGANAGAHAPYTVPSTKKETEEGSSSKYLYKLTSESPVSAREREDVPSEAALAASRQEFSEQKLATPHPPVFEVINGLAKSLRMKAYPPREPLRTPADQVDVVGTRRRPKAFYLTREQINQQLRKRG